MSGRRGKEQSAVLRRLTEAGGRMMLFGNGLHLQAVYALARRGLVVINHEPGASIVRLAVRGWAESREVSK